MAAFFAAGASAVAGGSTCLATGIYAVFQTSKRESSLETTFNKLESKLSKIRKLYKDQVFDGEALIENLKRILEEDEQ